MPQGGEESSDNAERSGVLEQVITLDPSGRTSVWDSAMLMNQACMHLCQ